MMSKLPENALPAAVEKLLAVVTFAERKLRLILISQSGYSLVNPLLVFASYR